MDVALAPLRKALAVAEPQRGVITGAQLRLVGVSGPETQALLLTGWLRQIRPGAYAIAGRPHSAWEYAVAAGLLAGSEAALSHATAAAIHRFPGVAAGTTPEITVPRARHLRLAGVRVHRVAALPPCDVEQRSGVGVTTPARTVVDLAARLEPAQLARIIDEGSIARAWTIQGLAECASRVGRQGRAGGRVMRAVLADRLDEPDAETALELRMIRVLAPYAPFETQYQVVLDGELFILDIAWPWWRVAAEVDGWWVRARSRNKFDHDSHRTNVLVAHGWKVAHVTSAMDDARVLQDVGRLLPRPVLLGQKSSPRSGGAPHFAAGWGR
jgi:very-short-patch-repair endonuclease